MKKIHAIDLFCGAGGLTHGLEMAGIDVRLGVDIYPACEYPYTANNQARFMLESVANLNASDLECYYGRDEITLLAGCAPCQTFSTYNRKATQSDQRWWLLLEFSRLVRELSPHLVAMENVPGMAETNVFDRFVAELESHGYAVTHQVVDCCEYGIPQRRRRLVLLASRLGSVSLLSPAELGIERQMTVRDAIGDLPPLKAGESHSQDALHRCASLSEINMRRMRASKPGGTWRDWPEELAASCHRKASGKTYPSVYGRMVWDEPAPTLTTQFFGFGNGRFGHPEQDRALSLREGAVLQSFPRDYAFVPQGGNVHFKTLGRLIGNAVPVKLGAAIGASLLAHVASAAGCGK